MNLKQIQLDAIALALSKLGFHLYGTFMQDMWAIRGLDGDYLLQWSTASDRTTTVGGNWQFFFDGKGRKPDEFYQVEYAIKYALLDVEAQAQEIGLDAD